MEKCREKLFLFASYVRICHFDEFPYRLAYKLDMMLSTLKIRCKCSLGTERSQNRGLQSYNKKWKKVCSLAIIRAEIEIDKSAACAWESLL